MAEAVTGQVVTFEAENAMAEKYVCVELGGSANQVDLPDAANEQLVGVIQDTADAGSAVPVMISGISKVVAGGVISKGDRLTTVVTTGRVQKAVDPTATWTGTSASTEHIIGVALEAASEAGQVIKMLIRPMTVVH